MHDSLLNYKSIYFSLPQFLLAPLQPYLMLLILSSLFLSLLYYRHFIFYFFIYSLPLLSIFSAFDVTAFQVHHLFLHFLQCLSLLKLILMLLLRDPFSQQLLYMISLHFLIFFFCFFEPHCCITILFIFQ